MARKLRNKDNDASYAEIKAWAEQAKQGWDYNPVSGKTNDSELFNQIVEEITRLIEADRHNIWNNNISSTARLVLATLTHKHGLIPKTFIKVKDNEL